MAVFTWSLHLPSSLNGEFCAGWEEPCSLGQEPREAVLNSEDERLSSLHSPCYLGLSGWIWEVNHMGIIPFFISLVTVSVCPSPKISCLQTPFTIPEGSPYVLWKDVLDIRAVGIPGNPDCDKDKRFSCYHAARTWQSFIFARVCVPVDASLITSHCGMVPLAVSAK